MSNKIFNCFIIIQINFFPNIEKHERKVFILQFTSLFINHLKKMCVFQNTVSHSLTNGRKFHLIPSLYSIISSVCSFVKMLVIVVIEYKLTS